MDESKDAKHDVRQKNSKSAMGGTEDDKKSAMGGTEDAPAPARSLRPRRAPSSTTTEPSPTAVTRRAPLPRPTGRILIVHANGKEYGRGAAGPKASNRDFAFDAKDYVAMRDSGLPYSGNPRHNKLLPLPRPTYTEFINRARSARMPERLDFLYVPADAPQPPAWASFAPYERVIWCGVSFRRFARLWTPERHHFFVPAFQVPRQQPNPNPNPNPNPTLTCSSLTPTLTLTPTRTQTLALALALALTQTLTLTLTQPQVQP